MRFCPLCERVLAPANQTPHGLRCLYCHVEVGPDGTVYTDAETWPWLALVTRMDRSLSSPGRQFTGRRAS